MVSTNALAEIAALIGDPARAGVANAESGPTRLRGGRTQDKASGDSRRGKAQPRAKAGGGPRAAVERSRP